MDAGSRRVSRAERKSRRSAALEAGRPEKEEILEVGLEGMSVQDLAEKLAVAPTEVVRALFMKGIMAQVNQVKQACMYMVLGMAQTSNGSEVVVPMVATSCETALVFRLRAVFALTMLYPPTNCSNSLIKSSLLCGRCWTLRQCK